MKRTSFAIAGLTTAFLLLSSGGLLAQQRVVAIVTEGTVSVSRNGSTYQPRQEIYWKDLLKVKRGTRAKIRCTANNQVWVLPADGLPRGIGDFCS